MLRDINIPDGPEVTNHLHSDQKFGYIFLTSVFVSRITKEKVTVQRKEIVMPMKTKQKLLDRKLEITSCSNLEVQFLFSQFLNEDNFKEAKRN